MSIWPVVSIAQLEPYNGPDPYRRERNTEPPPVDDGNNEEDSENDPGTAPSYEIGRLIGKRISRKKVHYLVKWRGYGNQHNVWYSADDLDNAKDLIDDYESRQTRTLRPQRHRQQTLEAPPTLPQRALEPPPPPPQSPPATRQGARNPLQIEGPPPKKRGRPRRRN